MTRRARGLKADESGTVLVLVLGFTVVAVLLVAVVVDLSVLFMARRSLTSAADSAALAGAQSIDEEAVYSGRSGDVLSLDPARSGYDVRSHVAATGLRDRFTRLGVTVDARPDKVTVDLAADVRLPIPPPWLPRGIVRVDASATATSPYVG